MKITDMPIQLTEIGQEARAALHKLLDKAINTMQAEKIFVGEAHGRLRAKSLMFREEPFDVSQITADVDLELVFTPRYAGKLMRTKGLEGRT